MLNIIKLFEVAESIIVMTISGWRTACLLSYLRQKVFDFL